MNSVAYFQNKKMSARETYLGYSIGKRRRTWVGHDQDTLCTCMMLLNKNILKEKMRNMKIIFPLN